MDGPDDRSAPRSKHHGTLPHQGPNHHTSPGQAAQVDIAGWASKSFYKRTEGTFPVPLAICSLSSFLLPGMCM